MKREQRYLVLKIKDLEDFLSDTEKAILMTLASRVAASRTLVGKRNKGFVCVADDWPEYENVWQMLENRIDGIDPATSVHANGTKEPETGRPKYRVWECKAVVRGDASLPNGFDFPPREAATDAIHNAGIPIVTCFSGWGGSLSEAERKLADEDFERIQVRAAAEEAV